MAVQAQLHSSALPLSPDLRDRAHAVDLMVDEIQTLQQSHVNGRPGGGGGGVPYGTTVFSCGCGPQESSLTCNASASKKRTRDDPMPALPSLFPGNSIFAAVPSYSIRYPSLASAAGLAQFTGGGVADSVVTSTSERPPAAASPPLLPQDFSLIYQQNLEIDALVRLQVEMLRATVEEARKKHCRQIMVALDRQVAQLLREKDAELENAARHNAELEEMIRQVSAESQMWFNVAKNNETLVSTLRTSLEHILGSSDAAECGADVEDLREGFGDSDNVRWCCF